MRYLDAQQVVRELNAYRRQLSRFPAGSLARITSNTVRDAASDIVVVDGQSALSAVRIVYMSASGSPKIQIVAASDLQTIEKDFPSELRTRTD